MTTSSSPATSGERRAANGGFIRRLIQAGKEAAISLVGEDRYLEASISRQIRRNNRKNKPVLMVHTMGKVGSTTVVASLNACGVQNSMAVYQPHFLSEEGLTFVERLSTEGVGGWEKLSIKNRRALLGSRRLNKELGRMRVAGERVKVVAMVRDPVATNLSGLFHNHVWWPAAIKAQCAEPSADCLVALQRHFLERYPHEVPDTWFDMEVRPVYGVDVFAAPFDRERGFSIYHSDFADVLVLKLEKLNQCAAAAFREFMGLDGFRLVESNKAEDKSYAEIYKVFRKQTTLPESYLDQMYDSRLARHFYSQEELAALRGKWLAAGQAKETK
jgi:hypothetical protein